MNKANTKGDTPSQKIDERIKEMKDWRGEMLSKLRALITQADSKIVEEWKWNVPVWSRDGIICTGETYKNAVKLTFAKGAAFERSQGDSSIPALRVMFAEQLTFTKVTP